MRQTPPLDLAELEAVKELRAALRASADARRALELDASPDARSRVRLVERRALTRVIAARTALDQALLAGDDDR